MSVRRFFASPGQFNGSEIKLTLEETRHLRNVLRLKSGDEARVFDGEGREFACVIDDIPRSGALLRVTAEIEPAAPESSLDLTLAVAAYKNDKLDLVVQKAVELGVARISPIVTERGEVSIRDTLRRVERWRKIAMEATKQCERALVMRVDDPIVLAEYLRSAEDGSRSLLMFSEKGGGEIAANHDDKRITALVGPKGGWEDSEIESAAEHGFVPVKLGRRIMRAETAAIAFAALLQHRFGDLN